MSIINKYRAKNTLLDGQSTRIDGDDGQYKINSSSEQSHYQPSSYALNNKFNELIMARGKDGTIAEMMPALQSVSQFDIS